MRYLLNVRYKCWVKYNTRLIVGFDDKEVVGGRLNFIDFELCSIDLI